MKRKVAVLALVIGALCTIRAQPKTTWEGVFTEEQAKRGEKLFSEVCSACHADDLSGGGLAPPLVGSEFGSHWNDLDLAQLFDFVSQTMPQNNPGSLKPEEAADLLAFLLSKGTAPAGQSELPTQAEALKTIKYLSKKPGA